MSLVKRRNTFSADFKSAKQSEDAQAILKQLEAYDFYDYFFRAPDLAKAASYLARRFAPATVSAALDAYNKHESTIEEIFWALRQAAGVFAPRAPYRHRPRLKVRVTGQVSATDGVREAVKPDAQAQQPTVMGLSEIAAYIGISRQAVAKWRVRRRSGFPQPLEELKAGPVWRTADIRSFVERRADAQRDRKTRKRKRPNSSGRQLRAA